jgi:hypothetical protein
MQIILYIFYDFGGIIRWNIGIGFHQTARPPDDHAVRSIACDILKKTDEATGDRQGNLTCF